MIEEIRKSIIYLKNVEGYIESCINQINAKQQELSVKEQECAKIISENEALKKEIELLKNSSKPEECKEPIDKIRVNGRSFIYGCLRCR